MVRSSAFMLSVLVLVLTFGPASSPAANDFCTDAVPLAVPSSILGSTVGALYDPEPEARICGTRVDRHSPGVWYTVIGTGNRMTATTCNPGTEYATQLLVFCSDCDHLVCVGGNDQQFGTFNPACEVPDTCEGKVCSNNGASCSDETECPSPDCVDSECSDTGLSCTQASDCPLPVCEGTCSVQGFPCFGPAGQEEQCLGPNPGFNIASTVTWCSRAGQEYRIFVHEKTDILGNWFPEGDFELSVSDDGVPCWGAVDCSQVEVVHTFLSDNGDDDGWADTNETVNMRFSVVNHSGIDLTGVEARLSSDDPRIACLGNSVVPIGDLAAGETKRTPGDFIFRVADVDRTSELQDFSAGLKIALSSDQFEQVHPPRCSVGGGSCNDDDDCTSDDVCENMTCFESGAPCFYSLNCGGAGPCVGSCSLSGNLCLDTADYKLTGRILGCDGPDICVDESQEIRIDLDLDAAGGSGPGTFFEGFEAAPSINPVNIDSGFPTNRCQYNDPSAPNGNANFCFQSFLGLSLEHAGAIFWQVDDKNSFSGTHSMYMGIELEPPDLANDQPGAYTTPLSVMESIQTSAPVNLGWGRACSASGMVCTDDSDCPTGEQCLTQVPELSFKHHISLPDERGWDVLPGHTIDRGVVQVQLASGNGDPVGNWMTIDAYWNGYDSQPQTRYSDCMFDPIDDGNTEDDYFDPLDPARRYGPSSSCFPTLVFSDLGDAPLRPFAPDHIGSALDGPGLQGETGWGTWVESKFSLDPFRGRRIRVRFLFTSIQFFDFEKYEDFWPGEDGDEGWWIDDVTISNTLTSPASLTVDNKDNSALAVDVDNDCVGDTVDCDSANDQVWSLPGEATQLRLSHSGGMGGTTTLTWKEPANLGGAAVDYTVLARGPASCTESPDVSGTMTTDTGNPAAGQVHEFLVQAANDCGGGLWGTNSSGTPRSGCP